ncbi:MULTISPECIES: hypothetical protein [Streptosporangium]|uniref:DUF5753 domain-containing protein n=1 Tax=Streptosporangium brasiliense TaxID=47480 RepID=A0ABT9R7B8_9ACTN|nr:hypothetical protein [Streptosporangium brasiliense]MDP9864771.1 hypothetical protein [Streptosporangium brasiliense]
MTQHTATAESPKAIDEATAESQDKALAVVQRLLKERGIRARCHHTISLGLFANRADEVTWPNRPLRCWLDRHPPELAVIGSQGGYDVTVTMGPRSGSYLVSRRTDPEPQVVRREHPEKVVDLIAESMS